jgi:hypothetical protein
MILECIIAIKKETKKKEKKEKKTKYLPYLVKIRERSHIGNEDFFGG